MAVVVMGVFHSLLAVIIDKCADMFSYFCVSATAAGTWRADRKALSQALQTQDADMKTRLDAALESAC